MLFKGRLRLPNDPGEGIPIDLELEDVFLSLESGGEDFGEWRLDTVEIKRLFSNQFALQLDGEEMVFVADDALGFAYDGLTTVDDVKGRLSKRRIFKGRKPKKKTVTGRSEPEPEEVEPQAAPTPEVTPDVPIPEVVPFFPESSPSFAESVAESAAVDESIAPVAPRPIEIDGADAGPHAPSSPPAVAESEPEIEQPAPSFEAAHHVDAPAAPAPLSEPMNDDDDELVIEDVSAYGYVPMASTPVDQRPAAVEPEPIDDEIEEPPPATGTVLGEAHPLGEAPTPLVGEVHPFGGSDEPERQTTGDPGPVADDVSAYSEPEAAPIAQTAPPLDEHASVAQASAGDSSFFEQWSSNGRAEPEPEPDAAAGPDDESLDQPSPQTQKSGRHARSSIKSRSSLFGRKKSREPEAHEHRYESSKTVGGITRRVCAICGHVSFAGEDVYQDW